MRFTMDLLYLSVAGTAFLLAFSWLVRRERMRSLALDANVTQQEPDSLVLALAQRLALLEVESATARRKHDDLADSVDHRFRRLQARAKRADPEEVPEEVGDDGAQMPIPFGGQNRRAFSPLAPNGVRPFGAGRGFGTNRG